uniref:Uncharacterized protein LOC113794024 n=1 Tax=Dermatophagoides pteronyssinus TaxID=6956 RepID=A0A6P6Y338_DERPT|nr:uncharacterized protein LOC113794024 [Dermatophagoides pteronyssinus]
MWWILSIHQHYPHSSNNNPYKIFFQQYFAGLGSAIIIDIIENVVICNRPISSIEPVLSNKVFNFINLINNKHRTKLFSYIKFQPAKKYINYYLVYHSMPNNFPAHQLNSIY